MIRKTLVACALAGTLFATIPANAASVMVGGQPMFPSKTIVENAVNSADHTTLVAAVKAAVKVPVVANGDITSPEKARDVLAATGADAIMIGRAAQGRPWIFREIGHFLATGEHLAPPLVAEVRRLLLDHLQDHYSLYGELTGVRSARKHIAWYLRALPGGEAFRQHINTIEDCATQWQAVADYLDALGQQMDRLPAATDVDAATEEQEGLAA